MKPELTMDESFTLTHEEVEHYHLQGYLGPFTLCTPEQMAEWRTSIENILRPGLQSELPSMIQRLNYVMQQGFGRHHDQRMLFDIVTSPAIIDRMTSILGEDLLLWRTMFFIKESGAKKIPWHQDYDDWPIEPYLVISAWIAIDEATKENGCIQLLPGSHREMLPLEPVIDDVIDGFPKMVKPGTFDDSNPVDMELEPGQFFLFNERLLHRSAANNSEKRRMGLAVRCITPVVRILDPNDAAILVSGVDRMGFNKLVEPPPGP
ncbi:MAG TPA: phytanoyl-CoA dioxygenase family protein [Gammaproteobacteria bacterium]|nr:phytanoyl-CoA dioxygenase family protein [Gammaproteobacteria bacterium]